MLLLCGLCHTAAFVYGSNRNAQSSKSWGYEPVYNFAPSAPRYEFRTTSAYISSLDENGPKVSKRANRSFNWGDDDDDDYEPGGNATGEVDDFDNPIGDTPWLLMFLLSAGYIAFRARSRKNERENG